jgi:diacylglycerol kinase
MAYIKQLFKSTQYAWHGIVYVFRNEQNFRLQLLFAAVVIAAMFLLQLSRPEMVVIFLLIILVLILELLNSALEKFVDILKPRLHRQVETVKDIMAAMVLVASLGSIIIGVSIFWPYIVAYLTSVGFFV